MDLPSRVGRSGFFFFLTFFISGNKNNPKHTKISKKSDIFCRILEKYFLLIFDNFQLKFLDFGQKTADFGNIWKKICQKENLGRSHP